MTATPVPVVSSRYLLDDSPPKTVRCVRPASRATFANEKLNGAGSCDRTSVGAVHTTASAAHAHTSFGAARPDIGRSYLCPVGTWLSARPPFKPCVRISRTRLTSGPLGRRITPPPDTEW